MKTNANRTKKPSIPERLEQLGSLAGFIVDFLATLLSFEQVNYWLGHKTELKDKLREVLSTNVEVFVSKMFQKTKTINVAKNPESFIIGENSVMNFLKLVIRREKGLCRPEPCIDNDLWNYFNGKTIPGFIEDLITTVYQFLVNLNHRQILDAADSVMEVKKVYTYLEGLSIIEQAIFDGEVDQKGTGIIVYFRVEGVDNLYRFNAYRDDGGQLHVNVSNIRLDYEWNAGYGVCFN